MNKLVLILIAFLAVNCTNKNDDNQLEQQEIQGSIVVISPITIKTGVEFIAKMHPLNSEINIVNAVVDCSDFSKIDSVHFTIEGCDKELLIKNDTVYLAFTPSEPGDFSFDEIKVLTTDQLGGDLKINNINIRYHVDKID